MSKQLLQKQADTIRFLAADMVQQSCVGAGWRALYRAGALCQPLRAARRAKVQPGWALCFHHVA